MDSRITSAKGVGRRDPQSRSDHIRVEVFVVQPQGHKCLRARHEFKGTHERTVVTGRGPAVLMTRWRGIMQGD
jgi:hypothetical protein